MSNIFPMEIKVGDARLGLNSFQADAPDQYTLNYQNAQKFFDNRPQEVTITCTSHSDFQQKLAEIGGEVVE